MALQSPKVDLYCPPITKGWFIGNHTDYSHSFFPLLTQSSFMQLTGTKFTIGDELLAKLVDVHVGKRIRHRRWQTGITQKHLADQIGVNFQQVQNYETGASRVAASKLWEISEFLDVRVSFFFEGLKLESGDIRGTERRLLEDHQATKLVTAYCELPVEKRKAFSKLVKAMAEPYSNSSD